nr:MAG TPA: hypothetical protein [Caudoviricetes sp.]
MLKMVDGTGIIGLDMVCPLGGAVSPPQPPNFDKVEVEGVGSLTLPNSLKAPLERLELIGNSVQGENPAPDNPQEIKSAGKWNEGTQKYEIDVKVTGKNLIPDTVGFEVGSFNYNTGVNASLSDRGRLKEYIPIAPGKKYLVMVNGNTSIDDIGVHFLDINRFPVAGYGSARFISPLNAYYVRIRYKGWTENDKVSLQLQDTSLDYEPYTEQTLTLTSDRPITKWDKLVKQGGEYGWLYQSAVDTDVKPSRLDLFPNGFSLFKDFGNGVYVYKVTNIKKAIGFQTSLCEQFKNKDGSYSTGDLFCYSDQPSMQMQYFVTDIPTLEEFKTWMEANPLTMVYKTTQAEFIPLSESEQTQLRNLHSYNGTTHVFVDSGEVPCGIKLTYRKEK